MAESEVRAKATWVEGLQFVASAERSGGTVVLGGSSAGSEDAGLRPMEALLCSLAGCTGMDVISILQKKRQRVTGFQINVRGYQAAEHPRRYERIELEYIVRGVQLSPQAVERSIELSQTKYCSVTASLNCEVIYTYRLEAEPALEG